VDPANSQAYFRRGNSHWSQREIGQAIKDYDEGIRLNPKDAYGFLNRGSAYYVLGDFEKAMQNYDEAIHLDPLNARAIWFRLLSWGRFQFDDESVSTDEDSTAADSSPFTPNQ
jgi:tetratricopeptide (TPR) repeat protein